jgi:hypothetical protein
VSSLRNLVLKQQGFPPPIPVATGSKAEVCGPSFAGIAGSNPAEDMEVSLLWVLCVSKYRYQHRSNHSSGGVLRSMYVSLSVIRCNINPLHLQ